jgi:hypothetical protein
MSAKVNIYCLDANVLIQAWQKYYSPKFCPDYWNVLIDLGNQKSNSNKMKIPNVCENMGIRWINDFEFIDELDIKFSCKLNKIEYL